MLPELCLGGWEPKLPKGSAAPILEPPKPGAGGCGAPQAGPWLWPPKPDDPPNPAFELRLTIAGPDEEEFGALLLSMLREGPDCWVVEGREGPVLFPFRSRSTSPDHSFFKLSFLSGSRGGLEAARFAPYGFTGAGAGAGAKGSTCEEWVAMALAVGVKVKPEKSLNRSFELLGLDVAAGVDVEKKSSTGAALAAGAGTSDEPKKSNSAGFEEAAGTGFVFDDPPKSAKASADCVFEEESEKGSKLET
jgi:hypothetical protein